MDYITIFWTSLIFLVSTSKFSNAVLPAHFQNPIEVREIFATLRIGAPRERIEPKYFTLTANPAPIYLCTDTRIQSLAVVRDNEPIQLLIFFSRDLQFEFMVADQIKFDVHISDDEILTLLCSFPTIESARSFFRMARRNASNYEPQNLMIDRVETYDEYAHRRGSLIPQFTFLRQNFIGDRNAANSVEFELKCECTSQPVSVKFTPRNYYVSNVVNGKEVMLISGEEKYILHFELRNMAQQFFEYTLRFALGQLEISDNFRSIVKPR